MDMQAKNWIAGVIALLVLPVAVVWAEARPSIAEAEIRHLLAYLSQSGCAFYRNGAWYDAERAREHLEMKYRHLRDRGLIDTAEDFIARAATESSLSGEAYRVRCGETVTTSTEWLRAQLRSLRQKTSGADVDF
jgi:hypothetical protein